MKTFAALRKLIRACVDDECTLRHEFKLVDGRCAEALARLAHERERFVEELERLGAWQQSHDGSFVQLAREAARNVWVTASGRNNADAITTCLHSRARTEAVYNDALKALWPDAIRRLLEAQRNRLQVEERDLEELQS